ncbi:MAG: hypothetical protein J2P36_31705 [Ktedonobacteraceae bacterium]|nr:hypothetical protein [Ktedonobacteraceae bacterium]
MKLPDTTGPITASEHRSEAGQAFRDVGMHSGDAAKHLYMVGNDAVFTGVRAGEAVWHAGKAGAHLLGCLVKPSEQWGKFTESFAQTVKDVWGVAAHGAGIGVHSVMAGVETARAGTSLVPGVLEGAQGAATWLKKPDQTLWESTKENWGAVSGWVSDKVQTGLARGAEAILSWASDTKTQEIARLGENAGKANDLAKQLIQEKQALQVRVEGLEGQVQGLSKQLSRQEEAHRGKVDAMQQLLKAQEDEAARLIRSLTAGEVKRADMLAEMDRVLDEMNRIKAGTAGSE